MAITTVEAAGLATQQRVAGICVELFELPSWHGDDGPVGQQSWLEEAVEQASAGTASAMPSQANSTKISLRGTDQISQFESIKRLVTIHPESDSERKSTIMHRCGRRIAKRSAVSPEDL